VDCHASRWLDIERDIERDMKRDKERRVSRPRERPPVLAATMQAAVRGGRWTAAAG
jgi:hypothetical protein